MGRQAAVMLILPVVRTMRRKSVGRRVASAWSSRLLVPGNVFHHVMSIQSNSKLYTPKGLLRGGRGVGG